MSALDGARPRCCRRSMARGRAAVVARRRVAPNLPPSDDTGHEHVVDRQRIRTIVLDVARRADARLPPIKHLHGEEARSAVSNHEGARRRGYGTANLVTKGWFETAFGLLTMRLLKRVVKPLAGGAGGRAARSDGSMERDRGYSDQDMAEVSDNPEWTEDEFARATPFAEAFPDLAASLSEGIEIVRSAGARRLSVSLSGDVAAYYESFGEEAEGRLDADLRKVSGLA